MIDIVENFISDWLKDILVVFIVISFLEIILPKGKMKRFVNFIIGLLIILVIISPFTDLEALRFNMDMYTNDFITGSNNQSIIDDQENRIKEVFISRLSGEIGNYVESNSNYQVIDININTKEEEGTFLIEDIYLNVKNLVEEKDLERIRINQIQIGEEVYSSEETTNMELEILISDYLNLPRDMVYISEVN